MRFLRKISFFLGISDHEFSRVSFSWLLKFFLHTITILGFTIILAMFVGAFGIKLLPFLFIAEALMAIIGTFALSAYLKRFSKKKSLLIGTFIFAFCAVLSYFVRNTHVYLFFGTLIFTYSVIITQLNIIFSLFVEELFSPLESERTFPIIESAEPVGGIFAGLITGVGVSFLHISPEYFVLIWGGISACIIPILFYFYARLNRVPKPHTKRDHVEQHGIMKEFQMSWNNISTNPFLKSLFWGVIIQWFAFSIIEFLYSSSVAIEFAGDHVGSGHGENNKVVAELAHGLGLLHIAIYGILLFFQIFIASKLQKKLGIVQTILSHPIVIFFTSGLMTLSFSFASVVATKGAFEVIGGPARNAYHSSFYIFRPHVRARAKEFLEGIARPGGMLIGISLVIVLQWFLQKIGAEQETLFLILSFIVFIAVGMRLLFSTKIRAKYTMLARKNLETRGPAPEKMDAIEILAQKGHENPISSLIKILQLKTEKPAIKVQVLKTLSQIKDPDAIPEILNCFNHSDVSITIAAVKALGEYDFLGEHFLSRSFAKHRVVDSLQHLFLKSRSKKVKAAVMQVFKNIQHAEIVPFLLKTLDSQDTDTLIGGIQVCGMFRDLSAAHYLEQFLDHKNPRVKAEVIIALWQFIPYRLKLTMTLAGLFESGDTEDLMSAIYTVGEIKSVLEMPRLLRISKETDNIHVKKHIYVALAKLEHNAAISSIIDMVMHPDRTVSRSIQKLIFAPSVEKNLKKMVHRHLESNISDQIHTLLKDEETEILEEMKTPTLEILFEAYETLGEEKEMMQILEVLEERREKKNAAPAQATNIPEAGKISLEDLL